MAWHQLQRHMASGGPLASARALLKEKTERRKTFENDVAYKLFSVESLNLTYELDP